MANVVVCSKDEIGKLVGQPNTLDLKLHSDVTGVVINKEKSTSNKRWFNVTTAHGKTDEWSLGVPSFLTPDDIDKIALSLKDVLFPVSDMQDAVKDLSKIVSTYQKLTGLDRGTADVLADIALSFTKASQELQLAGNLPFHASNRSLNKDTKKQHVENAHEETKTSVLRLCAQVYPLAIVADHTKDTDLKDIMKALGVMTLLPAGFRAEVLH